MKKQYIPYIFDRSFSTGCIGKRGKIGSKRECKQWIKEQGKKTNRYSYIWLIEYRKVAEC